MSFLDNLPTLAEVEAMRRRGGPISKGLPPALVKEEKKKTKEAKDDSFRRAVWARDKHKSRATGQPLMKSGTTDWQLLGEVDHVVNRSLAPELIYETSNGILLSRKENRLKKTACPLAPEHHMFEVIGPDDRALAQLFRWRDKAGKIIKETRG